MVRFGVSINASAEPRTDPVAEARHAEDLGFDLVTVTDHLPGTRPTHETWTLLTWLAAATERIGVGTNVLGLPYRHPAVTAKMAASLDRLSGGRLVLGLGAGGSNREFEAFGLPVREPKDKIDAFEEALWIIRGLWTEDAFTYRGRHYQVREATIEPKPDREIPVWLGTYGRRAVALTGRVAQGWIPSMRFLPPEGWGAVRDRVRTAAEEAGRDPDAIDYAYNVAVRVDPRSDPREHVIAGDPGKVADELARLATMGITFFNLWPVGEPADQRERFAREVIPAFRSTIGP
ncbi:MAG: LLM class flavin-dependent oxidoreductase [Actinomycetota bacterium]